MWVKICANTSLADARHAVNAGADAVGFVFAIESKRRVTPAQVAAITPHLPATAEKIGVFVEQGADEIADIVHTAGLTGVQLHAPSFEHAQEVAAQLRDHLSNLPQRLSIISVLHFNSAEPNTFARDLASLDKSGAIDAVLIDSRTADKSGGTGLSYDWSAAQQSLLRLAPHIRIIVAGGLYPQNVREAILTLRPWGVDVATGVEASGPGVKDPEKVESFIAAAREVANPRIGKTAARAKDKLT